MAFWRRLVGGSRKPPTIEVREAVNPGVQRRAGERKWSPPHPPPRSTTHGDARFADIARDHAAMKDALGGPEGIWFGFAVSESDGSRDPHDGRDISYAGERHLLTVAPTGSGKGSCAIIPNLLMLDKRSIICIDPKGQNAAVTARTRRGRGHKVHFLNPFNEHGLGTAQFNPLAHLTIDSPNLSAEVASLAEALIVTEGKEPHWPDSARNLVMAIILHLVATKGGKATLPEMRSILGLPDDLLVDKVAEMAKSDHMFIAELASQFLTDTSEIKNIISTARTQTRFLGEPAFANPQTGVLAGDDFRMIDFKRKVTTLYIILPSRHMEAYSRFLRLIVMSALNELASEAGGVRTLFMLDEFPLLGRLSAVESAFRLMRGYNVQVWPFVQSLTDLKGIYGDRWESLISNAGIVQWFTPNDAFTGEYLSKIIGKTTVTARSLNTSSGSSSGGGKGASISTGLNSPGPSHSYNSNYSASESTSEGRSEVGVDFLSPQDLRDLPEYLQIVTLAGFKFPILATREHYYEWGGVMDVIRQAADPDPFHSSPAPRIGKPLTGPLDKVEKASERAGSQPYGLTIHPEDRSDPYSVFGLSWTDPVQKLTNGREISTEIVRNAHIQEYGGTPHFNQLVFAQTGRGILVRFAIYELADFQIIRRAEINLPDDYLVVPGQMTRPDDLIVMARTRMGTLWPIATPHAPREKIDALLAALRKKFITERPKGAIKAGN